MALTTAWEEIPLGATIVTLLAFVPCIFAYTWISTTVSYQRAIQRLQSGGKADATSSNNLKGNDQIHDLKPPRIPYVIPWLGSALSFLNQTPGAFWQFYFHNIAPRCQGISTILLGGDTMHIFESQMDVQTMWKSRNTSRDHFSRQILQLGLSIPKEEVYKGYPQKGATRDGTDPEELYKDFLLNANAVNVLTRTFMDTLKKGLAEKKELDGEGTTLVFYDWFKDIMFNASTTALMGTQILEMNPNMSQQYWGYDHGMLVRFFGIPRFWDPVPYQALDALTEHMVEWFKVLEQSEPDLTEDWDPLRDSKFVRARHQMYERQGLTRRGKAGFDLGFLFGLSSNAIPLTGWILFHLLSPDTPGDVLSRILAEIESAKRPGADVDINALMALPLLNSVYHETLRLYIDILVTRELTQDHQIGGYSFKREKVIMIPSYLGHHDARFWAEQLNQPSPEIWYAERFLRRDEETGKESFSLSGTAGKFFPFGGGLHICPGRVFAKQEVLGSVAAILLNYEIEFVEYMGYDFRGRLVNKGRGKGNFPPVKQQYSGNGTVVMGGDIRVHIKRRD